MTRETLAEFHREIVEQRGTFLHPATTIRRRRIVEFMARHAAGAGSACDIGCHDGWMLERIPAARRAGVDYSAKVLQGARAKGFDVVVSNIDSNASLPFRDGAFDLVCSFDTIEHCIRTDHILNEINRILRDGGLFLCSVPNTNQPASFVLQLMDFPPADSARYRSNHYRDFTSRTFRAILRIHGFDVLAHEGSCLAPFTNRVSVAVAKCFPRLGATLLFAARKQHRIEIPDGYCGTTREMKQFFLDPELPTHAE